MLVVTRLYVPSVEPIEEANSREACTTTPTSAHHLESDLTCSSLLPSQDLSEPPSPSLGKSHGCDSPSCVSGKEKINLANCTNVHFELRDTQAGVCFEDPANNLSGWIPVVGRRKKEKMAPPHVLCRLQLLQLRWNTGKSDHSSDSSSEEDEILTIPQTAKVKFSVLDGTPGL